MNNLMNVMNMLKSIRNPQAFLNQQMNTPQARALINQIRSSGLTPQQFAMQYFKQNNVDITPIINMFANNGVKI